MAKDPAVLFYTADFLVGAMTMTDEQVGKYIRLLCLQHQKGHLTEDEMRRVCQSYDEAIYEKFCVDDDGRYYNRRMDEEIQKRAKSADSSRENGRNGGRPKNPQVSVGKPTDNLSEDENEDENERESDSENYTRAQEKTSVERRFAEFWAAYPKKTGKGAAEKAWAKIKPTKELHAVIMAVLQIAVKCDQWKKENGRYIPNPSTWLNQKRWEDEYGAPAPSAIKSAAEYQHRNDFFKEDE